MKRREEEKGSQRWRRGERDRNGFGLGGMREELQRIKWKKRVAEVAIAGFREAS